MHISALHLAREAFVECEADRVLKTALKQRVYARGEDISPGDVTGHTCISLQLHTGVG